jgi:hypothetical protein
MSLKARSLFVGMATYVPGLRGLTGRRTGGTVSARYCYSVWLRHLFFLQRSGLPTTFKTMVELGPGDSLGIGLAALLSGVERYIALDVIQYAGHSQNLRIFEELIALFKARAPIPDETEFPLVRPLLPSYAFPADLLTSARLDVALHPARLELVRSGISSPAPRPRGRGPVCYIAPWRPGVIESGTVDLVLSQTVLEYPPDLEGMYLEMCRWLEPGGIMSHEIDFKSIGRTVEWNGHWSCSDTLWRLAAGRRQLTLNREPHSTHVALMQRMNCRVVCNERTVQPSAITRAQLAPRFRHLTDEDLTTSSALIQAVKLA